MGWVNRSELIDSLRVSGFVHNKPYGGRRFEDSSMGLYEKIANFA